MNGIFNLIYRIGKVLLHPKQFYSRRIQPKLRHWKYPNCHPTAIVNDPLIFNPNHVTLGENVYVFKHGRISCTTEYAGETFEPELSIGDHTTIQQNVHITCAKKVSIGKWCAITHSVTITDIDHTYEYSPFYSTPQFLIH